MTKIHTIDAEGKTFGRVASAAAVFLMAKDSPEFVKNKVADVKVTIINASKTKMSERRMLETLHERYSGYPGGQKFSTNAEIVTKKGWKTLYELAVSGMLPSNKLKPIMMKHLTITE